MIIPLYGFLEGDTIGLLILADEKETVQSLADKLQEAASIRVARRTQVQVMYRSRAMDPNLTLAQGGFEPLERFDVVHKEG
jgi:Toluene-4-monooxygenase system protein B (TmoB)